MFPEYRIEIKSHQSSAKCLIACCYLGEGCTYLFNTQRLRELPLLALRL